MKNPKKGDLVEIVLDGNKVVAVIVEGPYPAVFSIRDDIASYLEETLAFDVLYLGKVYKKLKISSLSKIIDEL